MCFSPSGLEVCFSSDFYSNQLQLLISPHLPVPYSTTGPILLLLCSSTFVLFTFDQLSLLGWRRHECFNSPCFPRIALCKTFTFQRHILLRLPVVGAGTGSGPQLTPQRSQAAARAAPGKLPQGKRNSWERGQEPSV